MKDTLPTSPTRVRLYSHVTQTRFLHVEDALDIGKLRIFAGTYRRGQGMTGFLFHFVDLADARVIFRALLGGEQGFSYKEYKGTPPQRKQPAVSRVLSIVVKDDKVYIELKCGPGRLTPTGAIAPDGRPETEVNVGFKLLEVRRLAAEVLAYIHAWDVYRMMTYHGVPDHRQLVGKPPAYPLSPRTGETNKSAEAPTTTNGSPTSAGASRPVVDEEVAPETGAVDTTAPGRPATSAVREPDAVARATAIAHALYGSEGELRYGNGLTVDARNVAEIQAFQRYVAEKQGPPASKAILQAYYRRHMAT